ncbi:MAG: hypothetical protein KAJ07_00455 [Planctomycetes bacterium]|nr:hypothetical protein [Planctomycetota bacterium]
MTLPTNTLLTIDMITTEALVVLHEQLNLIGNINRQYDDQFAKSGGKIGSTLRIREPNQFTVRTGRVASPQDVTNTQVTLTLATQKGVDMEFSSAEMALDIDLFSENYITPAMQRLASEIEADVFTVTQDVYNLVGTPGTTPATLKVFLDAKAKLQQFLTPRGNRNMTINSDTEASIVDALKGLFQDSSAISRQYLEGLMGRTAGMDWWQNELIHVHTNGSMGGTPLVDGASQTGSSLVTDGWGTSNTITKGTVITLAGVFAVHPETKTAYPFLQQFVVTALATASSGAATLAISPSITTSGARQTVSGSPADNAVITPVGAASTAYAQNLAFHKDAFTFVTADLELYADAKQISRQVMDGISMRIWQASDIREDSNITRIDVLYGFLATRPQLACRVTS